MITKKLIGLTTSRVSYVIGVLLLMLSMISGSASAEDYQGSSADIYREQYCTRSGTTCRTGDVTGDGIEDIIVFHRDRLGPGQVWVYPGLSNGRGMTGGRMWHAHFCWDTQVCEVGDFDGNGRTDIVAFDHSIWNSRNSNIKNGRAGNVYVALNIGNSFGRASIWHGWFCLAGEQCRVADVNGDGRDDILAFMRSKGSYAQSEGDVWVALSNGRQFTTSYKAHDWFCIRSEQCEVADVTGDGAADLVVFVKENGWVYVAPSNTRTFNRSRVWHTNFCTGNQRCIVGKVNNDRTYDLLILRKSSSGNLYPYWYALSNGWRFMDKLLHPDHYKAFHFQ